MASVTRICSDGENAWSDNKVKKDDKRNAFVTMFECWHMIFCAQPEAEPTYKVSENAVNGVNEVRVDNADAESWLAIIGIMNIIMVIAILTKVCCKTTKKKYMKRPKEDV